MVFRSKVRRIFLFTLLLTATATFCKIVIPTYTLVLPMIVFWIALSLYYQNPKLTFVACMLSFALSYGVLGLSSLAVITILTLMGSPFSLLPMYVNVLLAGILQTFIITSLFRLKRLRKGMPYLHNVNILNVGMLIGIFVLLSAIFIQTHLEISLLSKSLIVFLIEFLFFLLLHWWQSQLTKAYRKRLAQLELESLRTELEQKTGLLQKLEAQNEKMGRLIHKDNKLIPAMEHAVSAYLADDFNDTAAQMARGQALLSDLKEFSRARQGILSTFSPVQTPRYNTGVASLDAILVYMNQRAQASGIHFYAAVTPESITALPAVLSVEKLVHVLSDLLENAMIATKESTDKQIQLQLYVVNGIFTIEVSDTGCSFEPTTLMEFGLKKVSTHLNEGGSGIGLLDIWKIKEEARASIHIHEYEKGAPFSKKIFLTFDHKNKYIIHTWRENELTPLVNRGDIMILPQEQ